MNPEEKRESWIRYLLTVVAAPVFIAALSSYVIPRIIEQSNRTEQLRSARLKKALEIGDRNKDFNGKLNLLKTRMNMFVNLNARAHFSASELREAQHAFEREYTADYLELDKQAWWWYWDVEREATYFQLLSPDELARLHELISKYGHNVEASVGAIAPLWQFLSSSYYPTNLSSPECEKHIKALRDEMNERSQKLSDERTKDLAKEMASIFARSDFEPR